MFRLKIRLFYLYSVSFLQLFLKRAWPFLFWLFLLVCFFLIISFSGLWPLMAPLLRIFVLVFFGFSALALFVLFVLNKPFASKTTLQRHIETSSSVQHRPLTASKDSLLNGSDFAKEMWQKHQQNAHKHLSHLKPPSFLSHLPRLDPYGVRAPFIFMVFIAYVALNKPSHEAVMSAFETPFFEQEAARLESWIIPPEYTQQSPFILHRGQENLLREAVLKVPAGSIFYLQSAQNDDLKLIFNQQEYSFFEDQSSLKMTLEESGHMRVYDGRHSILDFELKIVKDKIPYIAWAMPSSSSQDQRSLKLIYKAHDDYQGLKGRVQFQSLDQRVPSSHWLVSAPELALTFTSSLKKDVFESVYDVKDHPFSGGAFGLFLEVEDVSGQKAVTSIEKVLLPSVLMTQPLAQTLMEQRRLLALNRDYKVQLMGVLEALLFAPDLYMSDEKTLYLGLVSLYNKIRFARDDDALRRSLDVMYALAHYSEYGDLSESAQALSAARKALEEAIERGARAEEIARLTQELRQAVQNHMQALSAQQTLRNIPNARDVFSQDQFNQLLQTLEDLMMMGSKETASQALAQLQAMLDMLQNARPLRNTQNGVHGQDQAHPLIQALDKLSKLMRDQKDLMDKTYQSAPFEDDFYHEEDHFSEETDEVPTHPYDDRQENEENSVLDPHHALEEGALSGEDSLSLRELQQAQQALSDALSNLQRSLQNYVGDEGVFDDAERSMREAENALKEQRSLDSVDAQNKALDSLGKGAQNLAQALAEAMRQAQQNGAGGSMMSMQPSQGQGQSQSRQGYSQQGQNGSRVDPLGRPLHPRHGKDMEQEDGLNGHAARGDSLPDFDAFQSARALLIELRKRLGELSRPQQELDYFERLIKRFE